MERDDEERLKRKASLDLSIYAPTKRLKANSTKECLEKLGYLGRLLEMVQEFESSWRVSIQDLTPTESSQKPPFDGILRLNKKVKSAIEAARAEAREHVGMLQAAKRYPEATLAAQRISGGYLQLPDGGTIADLQTLIRLSENQEDFVAAEHYQERLLELTTSIDYRSQAAEQAMEKLWHLYQRSEQKLVRLIESWRLNTTTRFRISPLHRLVRLNVKLTASAELRWRVDPKITDTLGRSPIHIAAEMNSINMLASMTLSQPLLQATDCFGRTALSIASGLGHFEAVQLLLERGANINARPNGGYGGRTALQAASGGGHLKVVQLLLKRGAGINARPGCQGRTALQAASGGGHLEVIQLLLERGAYINAKPADSSGRTVLQAASEGGHLEAVRLLLERGADVDAEPARYGGRTALQAASEGGHLEVVQLLLKKGAGINIEPASIEGRTALQAASEGGHLETAKLLLERGADIDAEPADGGRTALQAASEGGHLETAKLLLERGADIDAEPADDGGRTALQAASEGGHLEVVQLLLERGAGINIEPASVGGRTALQAASEGGHLEAIQLLLERGADIDAKPADNWGKTALQAASGYGHLEIVQLLLERGADINAKPA
ncbi:hypothetical protein FGG08_006355, partial [Glutinoglossum americanum]